MIIIMNKRKFVPVGKGKKRKQLNINFNHVENILSDGAAEKRIKRMK